MNAEIISVGTELLLGQVANTNAQFLSQRMSQLGINMFYHTAVGDNYSRVMEVLRTASQRSNIIILTGGLGPTMDDMTKETLCNFLGLELVVHQPSLESLKLFFNRISRDMTDNNLKQAMFPTDAIVLPNDKGTAPGAIIEKDGRIYIILPGPPYELVPMFDNYVVSYLSSKNSYKIYSRVIKIYGMGESAVEEKIKDLLTGQTNPTIAPLVNYSEVTLRLTARCKDSEDPMTIIRPIEEQILQRLGDVVYGYDEDSLETVVARLLKDKSKTLSIAESCSGGLITNLLTNIPGISENLLEGFITYSNQSKVKRLGVKQKTLDSFGAVSQNTANEMAKGLLAVTGSDLGLSVTGIAGPGGGSPEKPVGLVYIGLATHQGTNVYKYMFHGDRLRIKHAASNEALNLLRKALQKS